MDDFARAKDRAAASKDRDPDGFSWANELCPETEKQMNLSLKCKQFGVGVVIDPTKPE